MFKSGWIQSTSVWLRPGVEEMVEGACAIRDSFLSSIPGKNPAKYDLTIAIKPSLLFELMEVNQCSDPVLVSPQIFEYCNTKNMAICNNSSFSFFCSYRTNILACLA